MCMHTSGGKSSAELLFFLFASILGLGYFGSKEESGGNC